MLAVGDMAFTGPLSADPLAVVEGMDPQLKAVLGKGILLGNLECVLYDGVTPERRGLGNCPMHSPTRTVEALRRLGVSVVSLANNHIMDFGKEAVASTIAALDDAGIAHFGAGLDFAQASRPALLERDGLRIGFLGFAQSQYPTRKREGTIPVIDGQARKIVARHAGECDFLVVCIHEGIEGLGYPMRSTVMAAHSLVDAGAGLVVGGHPHCIQGVEHRHGVDIFYSLGNFLIPMLQSDHYAHWRAQAALTLMGIEIEKRDIAEAIILEARIEGPGRCETVVRPIVLVEDGMPSLATGEARERILRRLGQLSAAFEDPSGAAWQRRDEIERKYLRMGVNSISWGYVLGNIARVRPRHVRAYLKGRFG